MTSETQLTFLQQLLLQHDVDALGAVDDLRHPQIGGEAAQRVGIVAGDMVN